jgi:hypothetical protein
MKTTLLMLAAGGLFLAGCGDNSTATKTVNTVSNTVTAPVNYLGAIGAAQQRSEKTLDVIQINQAVASFNEAEGRYPTDLNELVAKHYLGAIPQAPYGMKIEYDASNGSVQVVKADN